MDAVRPWLYVGKYRETLNVNLLAGRKIEVMLQLAEAVTYPHITSIYLPVEDGEPLPDLQSLHTRAATRNMDSTVRFLIAGDRTAPYGLSLRIKDTLRAAGVTEVHELLTKKGV